MAELRDAGALGFTDDGKPVDVRRDAAQGAPYQRLAGGVIALHEEDPALSGDGVMHEGAVSARLGMAGIPSISESTMVARDAAIARYEQARVHFQHLSCVESVQALEAAKAAGIACQRRGDPASPHADRGRRAYARQPLQDEPAVAQRERSPSAGGGAHLRADRLRRDRPRPARPPREGGAVRAGADGHDRARDGVRRDLHGAGTARRARARGPRRADDAGGALYGLPIALDPPRRAREPDHRRPRGRAGRSAEHGYASRSHNCCFHGRKLVGRVMLTIAAGALAFRAPMLAEARQPALDDDRRDRLRPARGRHAFRRPRNAGPTGHAVGEIVFTTSMSGYQEAMTDPSYAGQLITFTYPQIGNYGVSAQAMESDAIHAARRDHAGGGRSRGRSRRRARLVELARGQRRSGDHGPRHARARAPHPRRRRDARRRVPGLDRRSAGARADRGRAGHVRAGPGPGRHAGGGDRAGRHGPRARPPDRDDRHRGQALDRQQPPLARRDRRAASVHGERVRAARPRPRRDLPRQRSRRPGGARVYRRHRPRAGRQAARVRHLPRTPAALPRGRPGDVQAARSAITAPTTRSGT